MNDGLRSQFDKLFPPEGRESGQAVSLSTLAHLVAWLTKRMERAGTYSLAREAGEAGAQAGLHMSERQMRRYGF